MEKSDQEIKCDVEKCIYNKKHQCNLHAIKVAEYDKDALCYSYTPKKDDQ